MILITTRRVIFTPSKEVKDELLATKISITCYDKDGNIVKRVTSTSGEVEDPEGDSTENGGGENQNGGSTNTGGTGGGGTGGGDNGGGTSGGGDFGS